MVPRRLPVGAEVQADGPVHFRVWAPRRASVDVMLEFEGASPLAAEGNGYFSGVIPAARVGSLYRYRLDGGESFPDPASRFQPDGPHGASQVVDPGMYRWSDASWRGVSLPGQVIYEMHIGTFTRDGTWEAAGRELEPLAQLGITVLEVMPVADFCGQFGWGYDGVDLYAPTRLYGTPDEFRRFVDRAHALGMGVILDVVYNHLGPDGNYLKQFSPSYFTDRYKNEWGEPINFDGDDAGPVREFFATNAGYWIDEFHLDGLRLDATQQIFDASPVSIMREVGENVRRAARGRATIVVAENEPQDASLVRPAASGGCGLDGLWNDDFHHSTHVALTARSEAYYSDYLGSPQELISAVKRGFLYQGQWYAWQKQPRGTLAFDVAPSSFVHFIQNHDQVANSASGLRVHHLAAPGRYRAITALLLLAPQTPMLFQGQEFGASSPFLFFADHKAELARAVRKGRADFMRQFPSVALEETQRRLPDPADPRTFERCKLDLSEREKHAGIVAMHRDLLALRRSDPAFGAAGALDGAVIAAEAFVLRFFHADGDRLLVVNLGRDERLESVAEPLLALDRSERWKILWTSDDPRYGGSGTPSLQTANGWRFPGHAAVVLAPEHAP